MRIFLCLLMIVGLLCGCTPAEPEKKPEDTPPTTPVQPRENEPAETPSTQPKPQEPEAPPVENEPTPEPSPAPLSVTVKTPLLDKSEGRLNNVKLACQAVNGLVLQAGEEFSFNKVVGARTAERGYEKAIVFKDKEKVEELGGGICQLSSSLYCAALDAKLEVTERHAHQLEVDYVPTDMDATVCYGDKDFKFVNSTDTAIAISAELTEEEVIVTLSAA